MSILDNTSTMRQRYHEGCGGTILLGGSGDEAHYYCDRCRAFTYDTSGDTHFPTGTDADANRAASDSGDFCSPDAEDADELPTVDCREVALRFLTPPRNQGQIVLVSYAGLSDGRVLRKTHDQSDGSTAYAVADLSAAETESSDPIGLNGEPGIDGEWQPCKITE